jgi:hypothetical protein
LDALSFLAVLGVELTFCLLGRLSITWATLPVCGCTFLRNSVTVFHQMLKYRLLIQEIVIGYAFQRIWHHQ